MLNLMYLMSWFNMPSLSDTYTSPGVGTTSGILSLSTDYTGPFFISFIGILIGIAVGIPVAVLAVQWLIKLVRRNVGSLFKGKRGGRFRRR